MQDNNKEQVITMLMDIIHECGRYLDAERQQESRVHNISDKLVALKPLVKEKRSYVRQVKAKGVTRQLD